MITLTAGEATCTILPGMGAGVARLDVAGAPVLRPWSGREADGPFALGMNLLAPFSNRIAGGFSLAGSHHPLAPNLAGEPYAIHGDAFQKPWQVAEADGSAATLALDGAMGPFVYEARARYALTQNALACTLVLTNRAAHAVPYGGGFHPWFPRNSGTRLEARLAGFWPGGPDKLPLSNAPVPLPAGHDWTSPGPLPDTPLDAGFSGWDGVARITHGPGACPVTVTSGTLDTVILFAPSPEAGFFCFEPVSHPINAHNLPGQAGLVMLETGESLSMDMTLAW